MWAAAARSSTPKLLLPLKSWLLTVLFAVGPDLLVRLVLVDVAGVPLVAVLGDLLLQRVLQLCVCWSACQARTRRRRWGSSCRRARRPPPTKDCLPEKAYNILYLNVA